MKLKSDQTSIELGDRFHFFETVNCQFKFQTLQNKKKGSLHKYTENKKKNIKKVVDRYFFQKYFYNIYSFTNRPSLNSFNNFPNLQLYKIESCSIKFPKRKIFLFSIKFSFYSQIYTKFRLYLQQQNIRSVTFKVLRSPNFFMFIDS